jgi:hypothetical protein
VQEWGRGGEEIEYIQRKEKRRNSGNNTAEVKGNYKKVNVEGKSMRDLQKERK